VPLGRLLLEAIAPGGRPGPAVFRAALSGPAAWRAAWHTLETAVGGTLLATVVGAAMATLTTLTDTRAKPALAFGLVLPLLIAPQVTAFAWAQVVGPQSVLLRLIGQAPPPGTPNPLHSREGIILLLGLQHAPLVFLTLRAGLRALPRELLEAAHASGAGRWQVLRTVVLPLITPALAAGIGLAFVSAIGNFGIPALLGIPGGYTVLTTLIYQRLTGFGPAVLGEVAALSVVLALGAGAGVALQGWASRRQDTRVGALGTPPLVWPLGPWRPLAEAAVGLTVGFMLVVPLAALLASSLVPAHGVPLGWDTATLQHYRYVLVEHAATRRAFRNSLLLAGGAAGLLAGLAVLFGYFLTWRPSALWRVANVAVELPYALPGIVLAIAMILVFLRPVPFLGLALYNTPWIILAAYLSRFFALALRPVVAGYRALDPALEEAARMCGAGLGTRLRTVILPLLAPVAVAGALLVHLIAFSELTVSALLWSSGSETVGVVLWSLEQGGDSVSAAAVAVLSVAATLALMLAASLLARRLPPGILPWQA
jgi:iron(III) transport system permease protein